MERQVLAQYRRFWTKTYPALFAAPASDRRRVLSPVVAEMLLSQLLRNAQTLDRKGQKVTGTPVLLRQAVRGSGANAVVYGCLDMSGVVIVDKKSGKTVQRGRPRGAALTYMKRQSDGGWRAYGVDHAKRSRC